MAIILDDLQAEAFTSVWQGGSQDHKTAFNLLEQLHNTVDTQPQENTKKMIELVIDEKTGTMVVSGASGPVKIFNSSRKLLLIKTAQDKQAAFKISHLKKGRYLLEAEHQFFEFVK